ncbi:MAG: proton-translocating NADH-quinone oxidoreductase, chain [Planctomycetota bacterium]|nr:proton-translocating NADH-quinone oxidoreductase, chain [Planctomycetota bacterium]
MISLAVLVPLFPLLGALVAAIGGKWLKGLSHWPVIVGIGAAFFVSLLLYNSVDRLGDSRVVIFNWIDAGDLHVPFQFRIDGLTTMMLTMVTFVATLVAIFASGYMHGDPAYPRFFALVGLFVFSMTGLVLSNNYVLTYAFWEGVGVCSYLLVGFWHAKPAAAAAAKKAFLVNRVGDFGFAIAIFWMWTIFGHSLSYDDVLNERTLETIPHGTRLGIALLLFWAATAKSAQIPLYVWLPDAMEGPTPVSALIHAATMVTAGVYLIARSSLLFVTVPGAQATIAVVGCLTALLAALIALTQTDLKRVMAYSTVSQLGYMFMALGAGVGSVAKFAVVAAMFHLFTHAFFKALLFLASGSVMHAMGGVIDMRRFRGLRHRLPYTHLTFLCGGLALSGIPITAGFFSKDEILAALNMAAHEAPRVGIPGWIYGLVYWTALFTALLTAFYTGRAYFWTFWGPERLPGPDDPEATPSETQVQSSTVAHHVSTELPSADAQAAHGISEEPVAHADDHGHGDHDSHFGQESPPIMWVPLAILAGFALLAGLAFGPTGIFEKHLVRTPGFEEMGGHAVAHAFDWASVLLGSAAGVLGLGLAYLFYASPSPLPARIAANLGGLYRASLNKFYIDEFYDATVVRFTWLAAAISRAVDEYVVHNLVLSVAWLPRFVGRRVLGPLQNGLMQYYAAATALGVACLLLILLLF